MLKHFYTIVVDVVHHVPEMEKSFNWLPSNWSKQFELLHAVVGSCHILRLNYLAGGSFQHDYNTDCTINVRNFPYSRVHFHVEFKIYSLVMKNS